MGASGVRSNVGTPDMPGMLVIDQTILAAHVAYVAGGWEALGEGFAFRDAPRGAAGVAMNRSYYIQAGRAFGPVTPYARVEDTAVRDGDPYVTMIGAGAFHRTLAGIRYALDYRSNLKAEVRVLRGRPNTVREYDLQWGFSW